MFPNPPAAQLAGSGVRHHPHQPSSAAMAAAAGHQFHSNYHAAYAAAAYGHHQYNPYNIAADLNSNMYSGQQSSGNTGTQFGTSAAAAAVAGSDNWTTNQWPYHQHPPASTVPATVPPTTASNSRFDGWPTTSSDESPPTPGGETGGRRSPGNYGTTQSHSSGGSPSGTPTPNAQFQHFTTNFNGNSSANDANLDADSPLNQMPLASPVSLASPNARPQPARSPYEWMKKPSYQSQPEKSGEYNFKKVIKGHEKKNSRCKNLRTFAFLHIFDNLIGLIVICGIGATVSTIQFVKTLKTPRFQSRRPLIVVCRP